MHDSQEVIQSKEFQVAAFYCFISLEEKVITSLLKHLSSYAEEQQVKGTVLLATEGINGTICGPSKGVSSLLEVLNVALSTKTLQVKFSWTSTQAFRRFKARKKCEIVTMGISGIDPAKLVGDYVAPTNWNSFLSDPDTLVIDTRNQYEIAIGTFQGALNPHIGTFRDFPAWVDKYLRQLVDRKHSRRIAMFCTGGIRCEKATSYLLQEGFKEIHHLQGGILKYLEDVSVKESLWHGECFVFDKRVALNHKLMPGVHSLCHACGMPLTPDECQVKSYVRGVQCLHCEDRYTEQDRERFAERQRQIDERIKKLPDNIPGDYA